MPIIKLSLNPLVTQKSSLAPFLSNKALVPTVVPILILEIGKDLKSLFERKGFSSVALDQISHIAKEFNPMLWKLVKMKPKWGIDLSIDYVSEEAVFEVFHYEWDAFEYDLVMEKKEEIEQFVISKDWDDIALTLWKKKDEWYDLNFFDQTQWRTDYFGLSPEKFKNVIWED
mgnify:CR=1 FL=1